MAEEPKVEGVGHEEGLRQSRKPSSSKERVNLGKFETDFFFAKEMLAVAIYLFDDIHVAEEDERELMGGICGIVESVYQKLNAISECI